MKIYKISAKYNGKGEGEFARLYPRDDDKFSASLKNGSPPLMDCDSVDGLAVGDFLSLPYLGFGMGASLATELAKTSPQAMLIPLITPDLGVDHVMLKPKNFEKWGLNMDHMFLMFETHKKVLVTEAIKNWWDKNSFKGIEFELVDQVDTSHFVQLPPEFQ